MQLMKKQFFSETPKDAINDFFNMAKNYKFRPVDSIVSQTPFIDNPNKTKIENFYELYKEKIKIYNYFSNYPLLFVCPPNERDKRITISQIHTHKIRGANIVLIAEDDDSLKKAVLGKPAGIDNYFAKFIKIPSSGDENIFIFQATVVLQTIALKMSIAKMKYLNRNKVENHGVHPDVPKNVSKSITVD